MRQLWFQGTCADLGVSVKIIPLFGWNGGAVDDRLRRASDITEVSWTKSGASTPLVPAAGATDGSDEVSDFRASR